MRKRLLLCNRTRTKHTRCLSTTEHNSSRSSNPSIASSEVNNDASDVQLSNVTNKDGCRCSWYYNDALVTAGMRFVYWAYRHLPRLPAEWREYYRRQLRQEVSASRYVVNTWDRFLLICAGYHKATWVLRKFSVAYDATSIPRPYGNFFVDTTVEERAWAFKRSHQMKEAQALQRHDADEQLFGLAGVDMLNFTTASAEAHAARLQSGTAVHADDLDAPYENELRATSTDKDRAHMSLLTSLYDDKLTNPVLRARLEQQAALEEQQRSADVYAFEDEDDDSSCT